MLTDLQKRKFNRMFESLDLNADGGLDGDDVKLVVERHAAEGAGRASAAQLEKLEAAYRLWYTSIIQVADQNQDGRATREEFLAFAERMATDDATYEQIMEVIVPMTCAILDHDGDGSNDLGDYTRFCRVLRIGDEGADSRWGALSSHRGGSMSVDDMRVVLREFFRGSDPSSPNNDFLGAI